MYVFVSAEDKSMIATNRHIACHTCVKLNLSAIYLACIDIEIEIKQLTLFTSYRYYLAVSLIAWKYRRVYVGICPNRLQNLY